MILDQSSEISLLWKEVNTLRQEVGDREFIKTTEIAMVNGQYLVRSTTYDVRKKVVVSESMVVVPETQAGRTGSILN